MVTELTETRACETFSPRIRSVGYGIATGSLATQLDRQPNRRVTDDAALTATSVRRDPASSHR
jgi:hypothetical protein